MKFSVTFDINLGPRSKVIYVMNDVAIYWHLVIIIQLLVKTRLTKRNPNGRQIDVRRLRHTLESLISAYGLYFWISIYMFL